MKRFFFLTVVAPLLLLASVAMADEKLAITSTDAGIQTAGDADNLELARVFDDANAGDAQTTGLDLGDGELDAEATCFRSWGGCYGYSRCYSYSYCYPSYSYCYPSYSYCYPTYSYCYPTCYSYSSYCFPSYCGWGY